MPDQFDPYHVWLGIPPEEQPPNHYRLLGLRPFEANADVISNAVDQRRVFLRSVQGGKRAAQSQQLMNEVSAAGVALLDKAKKARYDEELQKKLSPRPVAVAHPLAANLPDPMAPLEISDLLPKQQAAAAPVVRTVPVGGGGRGVDLAAIRPPAAPVIKTTIKRPAPSAAGITALVLACATAALLVIAGGVWWAVSHGAANVAAAPSDSSGTSGPPPAPPPPAPPPEAEAAPTPPSTVSPAVPSTANAEQEMPATKAKARMPKAAAPSSAPPAGSGSTSTSPPMPTTSPATAAPAPKAAKTPVVGGRQPVPDSQVLSAGEEKARKAFASELKGATKPPQQAAVAHEIFNAGRSTQNDMTDRFVMIDLARTLFVQAGDVEEALTAARLLEIEYDIPRDHLLIATIEALDSSPMTPEQRLVFTNTAANLADTSCDAEEFERADKLSNLAVKSATKLKDPNFQKDLVQRRNHITKLVKEWNTIKPSLEKLKSEESDAAANLAVGKFYCFSMEDFSKGLKYLAASGEGPLSEAAKLDVAAQSNDSAKRMEAAAAWQKAELKIVDREDKLAAQRRERWLLQQAITGLSGIDRVKAEKRLNDLHDVGGPSAGRKTGEVPVMPNKMKKKKTT